MKKVFYSGQRVYCYYHFGRVFRPAKCGKVLFKLPFRLKHHFAAPYNHNYGGKCDWYYVKFREYPLPCLIPAVCMRDCYDEWEHLNEVLKKENTDPEQQRAIAWLKNNREMVYRYMHAKK